MQKTQLKLPVATGMLYLRGLLDLPPRSFYELKARPSILLFSPFWQTKEDFYPGDMPEVALQESYVPHFTLDQNFPVGTFWWCRSTWKIACGQAGGITGTNLN